MDQNSPQPPAPQELTFGQKLQQDASYLWEHNKIFLIVFGLLIVGAKLSSFVMDFMATSAKKDIEKATQQDAVLKKEEDAANQQANDLVKKADTLPSQEGPVTEDWNTHGKK